MLILVFFPASYRCLDNLGMATIEAEPEFLQHACIATRMLNKRRQLYDVKEILVALKEESKAKIREYDKQEDKLRKKDLQFQESLAKFELLSKGNESKQLRAAKRYTIKLLELYVFNLIRNRTNNATAVISPIQSSRGKEIVRKSISNA